MNKLLRDRLLADIDRCLTEARNCSQLKHAGLVGKVRQILVETLLIPLLPDGFRIGTGKVTDSRGSLSSETDVIIYDRRSVPPVLYDEKHGIFPIESVYYVIEVKSTLSGAEFERSIQNGVQLRSLVGRQPHSALFAFGSDLKEGKDSDRFIQRQKDMRVPLPVNIFCVAGREYGHWNQVWNLFAPAEQHDEIVAFLVGVINTLVKEVRSQEGRLEPGWYFFSSS
jgi:hypothetical protein